MIKERVPKRTGRGAQSVIELTVFGAVLIFLIGGIAMNYIGASFQQDSQLKAMRIALAKSYASSKSGSAARTGASYFLLEDRLSGEFGKYGSQDRQPITASGSGMFSAQVMRSLDWGEVDHLPLMDVQINGQTFVMTTAAFVKHVIALDKGIARVPWNQKNFNNPAKDFGCNDVEQALSTYKINDVAALDRMKREYDKEWFFFRSIVYNDPKFFDYGADAQKLFDMLRDGDYLNDIKPPHDNGDPYWRWEKASLATVRQEIDEGKDSGAFPSYDIDGDLMEENVFALEECGCGTSGRTVIASVLDSNMGDMDNSRTFEELPLTKRPGLTSDMSINTWTRDKDGNATSLDVLEGRSYSADRTTPVNISELKKHQYDIVERIYQLNPDMLYPNEFIERNKASIEQWCASDNCCAKSENANYTCFDKKNKRLYIRSRLSDKRGNKWMTNMDQTFHQSLGVDK
jgi:hypothetical protein